tara:strand:- start:121 stop:546 length:426 start_codon:yes stop_codon:yes gene_type:complete
MKRLFKNIFILTIRQKKLIVQVFVLSIYRYLLLLLRSNTAFSEKIIKKAPHDVFLSPKKTAIARDIALAITIVNKYVPWKNVCRHQSWQAVYLLLKYHIPFQFYVGVKKSSETTEGHSWVKVNDKFICGRCNEKDYVILNQ